ncbi:MAG TPA: RDD family protein [Gemmatimonadaceae bacterium]|jgi:uncharacterized RDD family membrane protein YckC
MYTTDALRERYARTSDADLLAVMNVGPERLTPESRQALIDEAVRRGLTLPPGWPEVVAGIGAYAPAGAAGVQRYVKANFGSRFLAYIIDCIVCVVPIIVAAVFLAITNQFNGRSAASVLLFVGCIGWAVWYGFTKDGRDDGQSIGKEMMDLMVVNTTTNKPCSKGESAIRALIWGAVNLVPIFGFFIEPIVALAAEDGRRLGDRAAGTQVIPLDTYVPTR